MIGALPRTSVFIPNRCRASKVTANCAVVDPSAEPCEAVCHIGTSLEVPVHLGTHAVSDVRQTCNGCVAATRETASVTMLVDAVKGGASGGTIASAFGLFDEPGDVQRLMVDAYCLDPPNSRFATTAHSAANIFVSMTS